jgi:2-polyprenyl-3-methyl-5-hydroxy-6-metoxy-1,4-benzoquinol methylase
MFFDPRRLLGRPLFYRLSQRVAGGRGAYHRRLVHEFLKIQPGDRVLDIGCGPADVLDEMPEDVDYHGFDLSEEYVAAARARHPARGQFAVRPVSPEAAHDLGPFDVVMAIGVVHHLTDEDAAALFAVAAKVLRPGGRVLTCDGAFVPGQHPIARVLLKLDRGRYVRTPEAYLTIARQYFPSSTVRITHDLGAIPYTHCVLEGRQAN